MKTLLIGVVLGMSLFVMPAATEAAGLVPCGGANEQPCQACDVVTLENNVVGWLVMMLGIIAAIVIVYAGFKLVTSGGNQHAMEEAKGMINNIIIGYLIVLAAWLMIDYALKALLDEGSFGVWNEVQCLQQRVAESSDPMVLEWSGGIISNECESLPNGQFNCSAQEAACVAAGGTPQADPTMRQSSLPCNYPAGGSRPPDLSAPGACAYDVVQPYFGDLVGSAQCIIKGESVCGARMISTSDVMRNDGNRAFSFGPMQINLTYHDLVGCGPGGSTLPCIQAFNGKNYTATVKDEELYQQCAAAAQNVSCNLRNGRIIHDAKGGWSDWSTAAGCGLH
jgi:hypothetical protein